MSAPAASLAPPAAPRCPRLLQRPVSPAQREAARRRSLYARLHLFNPEEAPAFCAEIRELFESMNPRGPLAVAQRALAPLQLRRAFGLDPEFLAQNSQDITTLVRQVLAIGAFDSQYSRLFYDALARLGNLDRQAAKRKSGKRTPELIEDKENAPARRMVPGARH